MDILIIFAILILFGGAAFGGAYSGIKSTEGKWHIRSVHACGGHERIHFRDEPCGRCGKTDDNWYKATMRNNFPFGWETQGGEK